MPTHNDFLQSFDFAVEWAKEYGEPAYSYDVDNEGNAYLSFRTRHPSFIAETPNKYQPERDGE